MSGIQIISHFCVFCYKNAENSNLETDEISASIKRFTKVRNGFTNFTQIYQNVHKVDNRLLKKVSDNNKLLNHCSKCYSVIIKLCEIYHQMKTELQLDWKLGNLVRKINYANRVLARLVHIRNTLEDLFRNDHEKKATSQNVIWEFRENVVKAGN